MPSPATTSARDSAEGVPPARRGGLLGAALALALAGALSLGTATPEGARADEPARAQAGPGQPKPGELNPFVLETLRAIPADGTHDYWWPKDHEGGGYGGVTKDLVYLGKTILTGEPQKRTYCCGLTFEVLVRAWEAFAAKKKAAFSIGGLEAAALGKVKNDWFCMGAVRDGPVSALVPRGLGAHISKLEDARPGDFVQLWRKKGSGHSVVFLAWERKGGAQGEIAGLRYWSTQTSTKGVGERTERMDGENGLDREKLYIARAGIAVAK